MKWIDTSDIKLWASKPSSKADLPLLISRLIRATTTKITNMSIPKGKSTFRGGWDGFVNASEGTEFVPEGVSLWEFGTTGDAKGKAGGDYKKRVADPEGFDLSETTFVFVTPQIWEGADEWATDRKAEGIFKDVKVYNASKLEEWLSIAPLQSYWLAKEIGRAPSEGVESAEDFWDNWKTGPEYELLPEVITAGRTKEAIALATALKDSAQIISIQASSKDEAVAFAIGAIMQFEEEQKENVLAQCVVVENEGSFKMLVSNNEKLVIIARLNSSNALNRAVSKGHFVILPLGPDEDPGGKTNIELPRLGREEFTDALAKSGMDKETAQTLSKESCRNITIMRRLEKFGLDKPNWAAIEHVRTIIPALLIGKWDESKYQDKELVSTLAGEPYEDYIAKLIVWTHAPGTPIYQIGSKWRISSHLDVGAYIARYFTIADLENFKTVFLKVTQYVKPALSLEPHQRFMATMYGKESEFSTTIREGIVQSLILIAVYGDEFKIVTQAGGQSFADGLVYLLFNNADINVWCSLNDIMPLIAEASPTAFLSAIEKALDGDDPVIKGIFAEVDNVISPSSYHTGVLWALESLAWMPDILSRVTIILAELDRIDPGGKLGNRPANSLRLIFLPWRPQTYANLSQRMQTLRTLAIRNPETAWSLLLKLLPQHPGGIAFQNQVCRWRKFNYDVQVITYPELHKAYSEVLTICLEIVGYDVNKLGQLIDLSDILEPHKDRTLEYIKNKIKNIEDTDQKIWMELRNMLGHHRSHPSAQWAIPEKALAPYEELYRLFTPTTSLALNKWLFDTEYPMLPEGLDQDCDKQPEILKNKRITALLEIEKETGLQGIIDLLKASLPIVAGDIWGYTVDTEERLNEIYQLLCRGGEAETNALHALLFRIFFAKGFQWIKNLYERVSQGTNDNVSLSTILIPLPATEEVWDYVETTPQEIQDLFWANCQPRIGNKADTYKNFGLNKLLGAKRYSEAIFQLSVFGEGVTAETAYLVLTEAATNSSPNTPIHTNSYSITRIFKRLDEIGDLDEQRMGKLELQYLSYLTSHGSTRVPKVLYKEIANNPTSFVEILKWIYKPNNEEQIEIEKTNNHRVELGLAGYQLLENWITIPGTDESGNIDYNHLYSWIEEVRKQANSIGRIEVADAEIAKVLACYNRKNKKVWPSDEICKIIDDINTTSIRDHFRSAIFNNRGTTSRGVFDGGAQERELVTYFKNLANTHATKWPVTSSILESLSREYEAIAKQEDSQALEEDLNY